MNIYMIWCLYIPSISIILHIAYSYYYFDYCVLYILYILYCGVHVWCVVLKNRFHHSICVIILKWVMWWHAKCFGHTRDVAWRGEIARIDWRQPGQPGQDSWTASTVRTVWWQQPFFLYKYLFFCCCCFSSSSS